MIVEKRGGLFNRAARFHNGRMSDDKKDADSPNLLQVMWSTLAAFFGVQNSRNRERDFTKGRPGHFILMGLLMTLVFIAVVMLAVKVALSYATGT